MLCLILVRTEQLLKEPDKSRKVLIEFTCPRTFRMNTCSLSVVQHSGAITESPPVSGRRKLIDIIHKKFAVFHIKNSCILLRRPTFISVAGNNCCLYVL